jgi:hypothetical protein
MNRSSIVFSLKFNFVISYQEFREHFPAEEADHFYDDVHQVVPRIDELFRRNNSQKNSLSYYFVQNKILVIYNCSMQSTNIEFVCKFLYFKQQRQQQRNRQHRLQYFLKQ